MTRFARAKGSKASNERIPNEATPWHVMKGQLLQNSDHPKENQGKTKSAKELLKEKEDPFYYDTIGNVNTDWAEFEETASKEIVSKNNVAFDNSVNEKKKRKSQQATDGREEVNEDTSQHDTPSIKKKKVSLTLNSEKSHCSVSHTKKDNDVISTENEIVTGEVRSSKKVHQKHKIIESALNKSLTGKESMNISNKDSASNLENVIQCKDTENKSKDLKRTPKKKKMIESTLNKSLTDKESININNKDSASNLENINHCKDTENKSKVLKKTPKKKKIIESASEENLNDGERIVNNKDNVSQVEDNVTQCQSTDYESKNLKSTPKKKKRKKNVSKTDTHNTEIDGIKSGIENSEKFLKLKENDVLSATKQPNDNDNPIALNSNISEDTTKDNKKSYIKLSKRQKRNLKHRKNDNGENHSNNSGNFNAEGNDWNNSIQFGKDRKSEIDQTENSKEENDNNDANKKSKDSQEDSVISNERTEKFKQNNINECPAIKRKAPKVRDDKEHKRRKPLPPSKKIIINGVEIEIVMFDGFPVKKEDAERLRDLKQKMIMKGIPKSEIAAAMKLERRKAEKALARVKKFVCYHCRKSGHNLSDCPELGAEQAGTGICFKCGSTEHTHFECKVTKGAEYRHATCFICREQGHIAKQCPDNPKGVYPQGGACKICGDVTHLKKDCPDLAMQKEDAAITVDTIANSNLESLEEEVTKVDRTTDKKNLSTNIVKF